ncbi:secernin-3-like [Uloborus diversus]|uniref:secernin-3-like n=1 Tax=Uloborus diversus TaxID=327109 RepID=UPI002409959A|nr:secernin-3-like [Uloborus diversus]
MHCSQKIPPRSCDTFAALPPGTQDDCIIFGKNSDRPGDEVQEVVYFPACDYRTPSKLKCTYIEIDQVQHTHAVVLSKPSWMWGAEMGANEHSVCIGNEAVWTKLNDENDAIEKLLGMDLLRLGLERGSTALEALKVIVSLLKEYGMGGNCSDSLSDFTYHNSFLIADPNEVWVLECAGPIWAAEKVTDGVRNISNELSIGAKIDLQCENLEEYAKDNGLWDPSKGPLNFRKVFGLDEDEYGSHRYKCGKRLLTNFSKNGQFMPADMFKVLRDKPSGICMSSGSFVSTGSQVSVLRKPETKKPSCHWFTATPDPARSIFKPFIFTDKIDYPHQVISPEARDRRYELYKNHSNILKFKKIDMDVLRTKMKDLEAAYVDRAHTLVSNFESMKDEASKLFKLAVEEELLLYPS